MAKKKRRRYKLLQPEPVVEQPSARVLAVVTLIQWAFWFGLAGVLVAFLLIASLYTHWRIGGQMWLNLWPASERLLSATGLTNRQMTNLALWSSVENGLLYGLIGVLVGGVHVAFRALRRRFA